MNVLRRAQGHDSFISQALASPALRTVVLALYTSRVGSEFMLPARPLIGTLVGTAGGLLLGFLLRRHRFHAILLLLLYVLFPFQSPELALLTGIVTTVLILTSRTELHSLWLEFGLFTVALVLYGLTLAPGVQPADSGEFQLVITEWGVAHPPGYPLYTVTGGIFARLIPFQDIAWRTNLFSAVVAALTLGILARTVRQISGSGWAGLVAAGILGTATAFWTTATQASIRPMSTLFMVLMIAAALHYHRATTQNNANAQKRALFGFALAAGFGVTHHASLLFPGSVLALAILIARPRLTLEPRRWSAAILLALSGAIPWLYLLARGAAGAALAPSSLTTWDGFWQHVLASGFAGDMFYYRTLPDIITRLQLVGEVLRFQWPLTLLILAGIAAVTLLSNKRWTVLTLGSAFAVHTLITATYRAPQTVEYMLPAYVCIATITGLGAGKLFKQEGQRRIAAQIFVAAICAAILWAGWPSWVSLRAYQQRDTTAEQASDTLNTAPPDSVILANWHQVTPLWYSQSQDTMRSDVTPRYVAPAGSEPILDTWARLISERISADQTVTTCAYYPETFRYTDLTFSSSGPCWEVTANPDPAPAAEPVVRFEDNALLTYAVQDQVAAGDELPITLHWQIDETSPYGELTAFSHLVDSAGAVVAQVDRPFMAGSDYVDVTLQQRHVMHIPSTALPGEYRLMVGLYRQGDDGPQPILDEAGNLRYEVTRVTITPSTLPPVTTHHLHVPLSTQLRLVGYDFDVSVLGRARLYLHWQVLSLDANAHTWQITVSGQSNPLVESELTVSSIGGFVTTALDIPDVEAARGLKVSVTENDETLWAHGPWNLPLHTAIHLPPVAPNQHYIPVGDVIITDYTVTPYDDTGERIALELTLRSAVPQTRDISLKIETDTEITGGAPAGGMLPSLKWYWSATLRDTTILAAPTSDSNQVTITFFDSFTSDTWPIFDPVLGQSSPALRLPVN